MKYSLSFRNAVLKQVLPPYNRSIASVARERNLSPITIHSWIKKLQDGTLKLDREGPDVSLDQRNSLEKFQLLMESQSLSEEALGEWIRKHGLHTEHLSLWERELEGFVKEKDQDLKQENAQLKKEAKRDKAAMAEALALLTLKKSGCAHGPGRGGIIPEEHKKLLVLYIREAVEDGARNALFGGQGTC